MDKTKSPTDPRKASSDTVKPVQQVNVDHPPTFRRSAISILVLALAIYAYQVKCLVLVMIFGSRVLIFESWQTSIFNLWWTTKTPPESQVGQVALLADISKRDEVVKAFKVCALRLYWVSHSKSFQCSTHGQHTVSKVLPQTIVTV